MLKVVFKNCQYNTGSGQKNQISNVALHQFQFMQLKACSYQTYQKILLKNLTKSTSKTKEKVLLQICKKQNKYFRFCLKKLILRNIFKSAHYSKRYKIDTSNCTKKAPQNLNTFK